METPQIPIIAIDGTSSSGKGTIASLLAKQLGFNYLNSGALYRLSAHLGVVNNIDLNDHTEENLNKVVELILRESKHLIFNEKQVLYHGQDIWPLLSSQEAGTMLHLLASIHLFVTQLKIFNASAFNHQDLLQKDEI